MFDKDDWTIEPTTGDYWLARNAEGEAVHEIPKRNAPNEEAAWELLTLIETVAEQRAQEFYSHGADIARTQIRRVLHDLLGIDRIETALAELTTAIYDTRDN